jgi:hypothetical protein
MLITLIGRRYRAAHAQNLAELACLRSIFWCWNKSSSPDLAKELSRRIYASEAVCPMCRGINKSAASPHWLSWTRARWCEANCTARIQPPNLPNSWRDRKDDPKPVRPSKAVGGMPIGSMVHAYISIALRSHNDEALRHFHGSLPWIPPLLQQPPKHTIVIDEL